MINGSNRLTKLAEMELDKSIILQKQVRDNAEMLRSEFLDIKGWEEQMNKADSELMSSLPNYSQTLPPIRRKKNSSRLKSKNKENGGKPKRIKSYDYTAWDQFDVDKVCEEMDKENECEDSEEESISREELEMCRAKANKCKVLGNGYVQEQKWNQAIIFYTEAIKIFPYEATYWANRALCHLKMNNLFSAESDCTEAINRNESYVKAYHRRATARMASNHYTEAIDDLEMLLTLESGNKEAKRMLATAQKAIQVSKPINLNISNPGKPTPKVEKPTITLEIVDVLQPKTSTKEMKETSSMDEDEFEMVYKNETSPSKYRDWLPDIYEDVEEIKALEKPPHHRSRKSFRNVPITTSNFTKLSVHAMEEDPQKVPEILEESKNNDLLSLKEEQMMEETESVSSISEFEIPSVPKTAVQFMMVWNQNKSPDFRYQYLKQIPPMSIPGIFQTCLEPYTFNEIVQVLKNSFIPRGDAVFNYLYYLSKIKRFRMFTMFMGTPEKKDLKVLFNYCAMTEFRDTDSLLEKYEI